MSSDVHAVDPSETAPAQAEASLRLPNLVIAGVTKAGTTSLYRYLRQHPDIFPSDQKELRYFLPLRYGEPVGPLHEYAAHFDGWSTQRYGMEASPGYFYGGAAVAEALAATLPDVRVVIMLREPGQRAWSFFNFMRSRAQLPQEATFEPWLDRCEELVQAGVDQDRSNHPYSGLGTGRYDQWIDAWISVFGDRLRIVFFDELTKDTTATVKSLCRWLGIDEAEADSFAYHVENRTRQFRFRKLQRIALRVNMANARFLERHPAVKRSITRVYYSLNRQPARASMSPEARRRLDEFYAPTLAHLAAVLRPDELERSPRWVTGRG